MAAKTFLAGERVTFGSNLKCDITANDPKLPECYNLLQKKGTNYILRLYKGVEGTLQNGKHLIPFEALIDTGLLKEKKGFYALELRLGFSGKIRLPHAIIHFDYKEWTETHLPLKWPFTSKKDGSFLIILISSMFLHIAFLAYLNTVEIRKVSSIEAIKSMSPRFARLILNPAKKVEQKVIVETKKEEVEEKKEEPAKEVKKEESAKEERKTETASETAKKVVRERVKSAGILGVITASGGIMASLEKDDIWRDVDTIIAQNIKTDARDETGDTQATDVASLSEGLLKTIKSARTSEEIIREKKEKASLEREDVGAKKVVQRREEDVYRTVKSYSGGLKYLYNNVLLKNPRLKGTVTVKISIVAEGAVSKTEIVNSTMKDNDLEEAIIKRIYRWKFNELKSAEEFTIDYTFDFTPSG